MLTHRHMCVFIKEGRYSSQSFQILVERVFKRKLKCLRVNNGGERSSRGLLQTPWNQT